MDYKIETQAQNIYIEQLNDIANVISGKKFLFVCEYKDNKSTTKQILLSDIPDYYGKSCGFYITDYNIEKFNSIDILNSNIRWFGDFDFPNGGAGTLLFILAGREIS
jgi:uncharacterized protein (DUF3820 family)